MGKNKILCPECGKGKVNINSFDSIRNHRARMKCKLLEDFIQQFKRWLLAKRTKKSKARAMRRKRMKVKRRRSVYVPTPKEPKYSDGGNVFIEASSC